jgi:hypothetical protein
MIPIRLTKGKLNLVIQGQRYEFRGGESRTVSTEVADVCLAKKDNAGNPLFERVTVDKREIEQALGVQLQWRTWQKASSL